MFPLWLQKDTDVIPNKQQCVCEFEHLIVKTSQNLKDGTCLESMWRT